ncbi:ATP-binding cassette sub-family G member 4 isoform X2 [Cephus cinctus]|uniref:ATP-binding cassette sub-family G member 4 isoform X2 n=1 Tax=Cephus cinctus TaxID=211228 RepID=A0AAJ7RNK6_CEPCN|nr:ATP-binding cassette sub-family G member 4 isoform X2 [Cephus cinctus]
MIENRDNTENYDEHCSVNMTDNKYLLETEGCIEERSQILIEFNDLSYSACNRNYRCSEKHKQKQILYSVSGHLRPGRLTALIGPSGAGKSTLLNIISGLKQSNLKGSVTVNGAERNVDIFRRLACYIPQDFVLLPLLTAKETLYIAACLKLGFPHTTETRKYIVNEIANRLGLSSCLHTPVGKLSGGEKKRLSFGVELITNPTVMLLDEPTSGLDSAASKQVIDLLHAMAQTGRTVVCAIHQPSSQLMSKFDDVIVMNQGTIVYCGPQIDIYDTFKRANFVCPQFYNISEYAAIMSGRLTEYPEEDEDGIPMPGRYSVSKWRQQKVLLCRAIICISRDNTMTKLRLAAHVIVAFLLGLVFHNFGDDASKAQSNISCLFFFLLFLFFANAMPAVQMFPTEAAVFLREHLNNWYSLQSYYISKVLSDFPLQILCPTLFLLISYCMTGQPFDVNTMMKVWLVCTLLTILSQSFGIAAGAAFNTQAGTFLIPAMNIPMFLFAGFFIKLNEVPEYLQPICTVSYFRYAFEGVLEAIYNDDRPPLQCPTREPCFIISSQQILKYLNMQSSQFYVIVLALCAWILCLHVCIYTVLRLKLYVATK